MAVPAQNHLFEPFGPGYTSHEPESRRRSQSSALCKYHTMPRSQHRPPSRRLVVSCMMHHSTFKLNRSPLEYRPCHLATRKMPKRLHSLMFHFSLVDLWSGGPTRHVKSRIPRDFESGGPMRASLPSSRRGPGHRFSPHSGEELAMRIP